ncbi:conserved hypothetical protein [Gloeothece citriformis PCC 7424]|uniref:Uncharacterized protein n=1 Tax=Gloeothece citriformis (strain PCC 7424) TaxID=65393 RepID=B7KEA8_GLOC7|nr:glycosyltransferase family 39 protein [Gloeothece citriformis]ACK73226.1 conserved hypothetical protein [Gloeothece citriformis PCC 7424]
MRLRINQSPKVQTRNHYDWVLLLSWTVLGCWLRFLNLTAKPPWTDEFATMVFSLGNHYNSVLLDQVISLEGLLSPLKFNPDTTIFEVVSLLLQEDNHPPLYFILAHWWMKLFPLDGEYMSVLAARSLPALLGGLSIPAVYILGRIAFSSRLVGQLSAMMMAVSPYGVFIAQEARHYTLGILLVIFSLCCLVIAVKQIEKGVIISAGLMLIWITLNCLGLGVHYFFILTLCAQGMSLLFNLPYQLRRTLIWRKNCWRLGLVALFTLTLGMSWVLWIIPQDYGKGMTEWIRPDNWSLLSLISPIFQLLAAWVTMIILLPIESSYFPLVIFSGLLMLFFLVWSIPKLNRGLKICYQNLNYRLGIKLLLGFVLSAIALFFGMTYFLRIDITRGARYSFVYFPAIPVLLGGILSVFWNPYYLNLTRYFRQSQMTVLIIGFIGLLSAMTINFDLGYQKYYLPNQLVKVIEKTSSNQVLIATTHQNLVQTGEMMGIGWELYKNPLPIDIKFLLAHTPLNDSKSAIMTLQANLNQLSRPLDVWLVNFKASVELKNCEADFDNFSEINGYNYQRYHCF